MLAYVDANERTDSVVIDGYTSNKTIKGIIRDVARAVEKYDRMEAESLRSFLKYKIDEYNNPFIEAKNSNNGYFFEVEEVPCATKYNENTSENEYREGFTTYFCIRIIK